MNSEQIKDMHLLYNAVYDEELREQFNEYNNTIYDEDIVEVATEYFYSYGLNEDGIGILIEKVGLESFVEYVYDLSEDLHVLTEARARKKYSGPSYDEVMAGIDAREAKARAKKEAKKNASEAASEKKETERTEPESRGVESQAKAEQPKSKKPEKSGIARAISGAVARAQRDTELLRTSWNTAREVGRGHEANVAKAAGTVAGAAHGAAKVAHRLGQEAGKSETGKKIKKVLFGEEVEAWVNQLVEEGYDLSEYTWDEMAEIYEDKYKPKTKAQLRRYVSALTKLHSIAIGKPESPKEEPKRTTRSMKISDVDIREDIYDVILSHLIEEGYAESVEQAEVIMVNMSEDWREDIMEKTAMAKRGYDETSIRNKIAKNTKGGESADRATALEKQTTYDPNKDKQRQDYARAQRGTFRKTNSSSPRLRGYGYQSSDPAVKELQSARGNQRGDAALTPKERKMLNR